MEFLFTDRKFNIIDQASTTLPKAIRLYNDKETDEIEVGGSLLEGSLFLRHGHIGKAQEMAKRGNFVLFKNEDGESKFYTILRTQKNRKAKELWFYGEDAGLDLLNETVGKYTADKAYPIAHYIEKFTFDSGFEIGINEIAHLTRKLKWEGQATATKRVLSCATQFDNAEIKYRFEVDKNKVVRKYIDILKRRGEDLNITLRLGHEVDNIITTESIENLATALKPEGGTPEGKEEPITLKGVEYDDGRFYVNKVSGVLRDRVSIQLWSRYLTNDQAPNKGHIIKHFPSEETSQSALLKRAINHLKLISEPEVNYEVDIVKLPDNVRIGDRVNIVDEEDELYLSTRILKFERSRSKGTNIATLGDFLIKESGIHQSLQELADKISTIPKGDTWYPWTRYADDDKGTNMSLFPQGKAYRAVKYVVNQAVASDDPKEYEGLWEKIQGPVGDPGKPGVPGENGKASIFYTAWANDLKGKDFTINKNQAPGKGYFGTYSSYSTIQSTNYQDYAWVELAGAFEQAIKDLEKAINNVKEITRSITSPINPKKGDQWWQLNANGNNQVVAFNEWNGSSWVPSTIAQAVLNIVELNAVEINGSVITGSSFLNYWDKVVTNGRKGVTKIENGQVRIDYTTANGIGYVSFDDASIQAQLKDNRGKLLSGYTLNEDSLRMVGEKPLSNGKQQSAAYRRDGITMTDESKSFGAVNLTYEDLINIPLKNMTAMFAPNWDGYSTEYYPQIYRAGKNIQIFGAMKPNTTVAGGATWQTVLTLPPEYRPLGIVSTAQQGSLYNTFALQILKNGEVQVSRHRNKDENWLEFSTTSWVNISFSFITG